MLLCKLPEEPQAVVMVGDEPRNMLLCFNDVTEVWQLANTLEHEVERVHNTLHHRDMWMPAMTAAYVGQLLSLHSPRSVRPATKKHRSLYIKKMAHKRRNGSLLLKDLGSCSVDRGAISNEAEDFVWPTLLHAFAPQTSSGLCILHVALAVLCKEEARAPARGCQHIHQRAVVGISPSIAHERDACVVSFLPVQPQVCIHPLACIPQQPVPEWIVPWACIAFPLLPQALREAVPAWCPAQKQPSACPDQLHTVHQTR